MKYPLVMTEADTLAHAVQGRSIARFGDGELKLALGRAAKSQRAEPGLRAFLKQMLASDDAPARAPHCIVCIPRLFPPGPKADFWRPYTGGPYLWLYRQGASYGSAFITRPDSAPDIDRPEYWDLLAQLWRGKDVVLVRGSGKSLTADRLPGAGSVEEIVAPVQHAWTEAENLFKRLRGERRTVLMCLGATATALCWRLSWEGVHAVDLGHVGMFTKRLGPDGRLLPKAADAKE